MYRKIEEIPDRKPGPRHSGTALLLFALNATILFTNCAKYDAEQSIIGLLLLTGSGQFTTEEWLLDDWTRRRRITLNNSGRAENLLDFPVLVRLDASRIDYAQSQNSGQDLRFIDADGSSLSHEIETWNEAGSSWIWVRVPRVDASSASDFLYMYYGNDSIADSQNPANVWTSTYETVLHLNGGSGDSSAAGNNGIDSGTVNTAAKIGNGRDCTGAASAYISMPATAMASAEGEATMFLWVNPDDNAGTRTIYDEYITAGTLWQFSLRIDNFYTRDLSTGDAGGRNNDLAPPVLSNAAWQLVTLVYSIANGSKKIYHNGVEVASTNNSIEQLTTTRNAARICFAIDGTNFDGRIDEFRFANTARSGAWISAQYASMNDALLTVSAEEIRN